MKPLYINKTRWNSETTIFIAVCCGVNLREINQNVENLKKKSKTKKNVKTWTFFIHVSFKRTAETRKILLLSWNLVCDVFSSSIQNSNLREKYFPKFWFSSLPKVCSFTWLPSSVWIKSWHHQSYLQHQTFTVFQSAGLCSYAPQWSQVSSHTRYTLKIHKIEHASFHFIIAQDPAPYVPAGITTLFL